MIQLKSRIHIFLIILIAFVSALGAFAKIGYDLNAIDENGLRQGYWIVKGYMTQDREYAANTTVEEGKYVHDKKEGLWKRYWPNGHLKNEIHYKNNRPFGRYSIYYENGQLEESGNWAGSKNVGEFHRLYENGNPQQAFFFSDSGKRNGIQKYYHENGQVELEVNIVNGKENGVLRRYRKDGRIKQEMILNDGKLNPESIKNFNKPVKKKLTPAKEVAPISVPEIDFDSLHIVQDVPNQAFTFKPNGHNVLYNEDRQITQIGEFKNGRLWNGKWHQYNSDGILVGIEFYQDGSYIGKGEIEKK